MIEARRLLPLYREALGRDRDTIPDLTDCDRCRYGDPKKARPARSKEDRQQMGCGFEKRIAKPKMVYTHPAYPSVFEAPSTCIGYAARLPIIRESDALSIHWERHTLDEMLGAPAPEFLLETMADLKHYADVGESYRIRKMTEDAARPRHPVGRR